jgi:hypothetical protein
VIGSPFTVATILTDADPAKVSPQNVKIVIAKAIVRFIEDCP